MQYVRNLSDSVSTAWNSINPATLSGAIDVIVVERDDGTLACSPFHVRFGKFSLLRPYEKKVEFRINGTKQHYSMKLGEGGEAFFVFETSDSIPESMQTSPLVSPASSPPFGPADGSEMSEPDHLELDGESGKPRRPAPAVIQLQSDENGTFDCIYLILYAGSKAFMAHYDPRHDYTFFVLPSVFEFTPWLCRLAWSFRSTSQRYPSAKSSSSS